MKLDFEYGHGLMSAELPDNTDVFIPGTTVPDPDYIPEDKLEAAYLESLRNPIGMKPLSELAFPGAKVVFIVPDRVKGGEQPTSHRKVSIKLILKELYAAGVKKEDISSSSSPTACIPVPSPRITRPSSARSCSMSSGTPIR